MEKAGTPGRGAGTNKDLEETEGVQRGRRAGRVGGDGVCTLPTGNVEPLQGPEQSCAVIGLQKSRTEVLSSDLRQRRKDREKQAE